MKICPSLFAPSAPFTLRKCTRMGFASLTLSLMLGLTAAHAAPAAEPVLYQYATIDALLAGAYDGDMSVAELSKHGNFGIGTYNRVDGEMIVIDGQFYRAQGNGKVQKADPADLSPFAVITDFKPDTQFALQDIHALVELESKLDSLLPNKNLIYAIRISGDFDDMTTRAISPQEKPYKPLAEVTKTQSVFHLGKTSGQLIAFRSPAFVKGFNVPGYHWHYLAADRQSGGHVLALALANARVEIAQLADVEIKIPTTKAFADTDQSQDRSKELHAVESARKP
jgi:acetolactate decarboxylase